MDSLRAWLHTHHGDLDALVFDIDGVLMVAHHPVEGAVELMDWLHAIHKPFFLLTNDGCHSPEEKTAALRACGMDFSPDEIVSCSHGLGELAEERGWACELFFAMGALGTPCYGERAGLRVTRDLDALDRCTGVVIGEKDYDWETTINAVFNFLIAHPAAPLIVPNPDEYFARRPDQLQLASGAVGRFLRQICRTYGHDLEPIYLGKPFEPIFLTNHHRVERELGRPAPRGRVMIVGDSLESDVRGGRDFGYRTALMLTGITPRDALTRSRVGQELVFEAI